MCDVYSVCMSIKKVFIISLIIGLLIPIITHAQIQITEIMYDPEGSDTKREWVEIYNNSDQSIDHSTWFLHENNVFHKLVAQAGSIVSAKSYAIIVDSIPEVLADYASYVGPIFDSVFSLNNTGETISLANSQKSLIDTFTYNSEMGAMSDGNSIQINDGVHVVAGPTFGEVNKTESELPVVEESTSVTSTTTSTSNTSTTDSTHSEQVTVSNYVPTSPFKIGAGRDRTVSINTPLEFEAYLSKPEFKPRFHWNFGDFNEDGGRKTTHVYVNTGVYEVVLEGKTKEYAGISRTQIHVIEPQLEIVQSTTSISIHNQSKQEINIGNFVLNFKKDYISIPRNTIVAGGASITTPIATSTILQSFEYPNGEIYRQFDTI